MYRLDSRFSHGFPMLAASLSCQVAAEEPGQRPVLSGLCYPLVSVLDSAELLHVCVTGSDSGGARRGRARARISRLAAPCACLLAATALLLNYCSHLGGRPLPHIALTIFPVAYITGEEEGRRGEDGGGGT